MLQLRLAPPISSSTASPYGVFTDSWCTQLGPEWLEYKTDEAFYFWNTASDPPESTWGPPPKNIKVPHTLLQPVSHIALACLCHASHLPASMISVSSLSEHSSLHPTAMQDAATHSFHALPMLWQLTAEEKERRKSLAYVWCAIQPKVSHPSPIQPKVSHPSPFYAPHYIMSDSFLLLCDAGVLVWRPLLSAQLAALPFCSHHSRILF